MKRRRMVQEHGPTEDDGAQFVEIDPGQLARVFDVPSWLRDLGFMSWLIVGTLVLLGGVVWLLALTAIIVVPVITAAIVAAVLSPVVGWLARHRVGRGGGAALVLVGVIALGGLIVVLLVSGVTSQAPDLKQSLQGAVDKLQSAAPGRRREREHGAGRGRRRERVGSAMPSTRCSRAWAPASPRSPRLRPSPRSPR